MKSIKERKESVRRPPVNKDEIKRMKRARRDLRNRGVDVVNCDKLG